MLVSLFMRLEAFVGLPPNLPSGRSKDLRSFICHEANSSMNSIQYYVIDTIIQAPEYHHHPHHPSHAHRHSNPHDRLRDEETPTYQTISDNTPTLCDYHEIVPSGSSSGSAASTLKLSDEPKTKSVQQGPLIFD